jgi:hypothetical protein
VNYAHAPTAALKEGLALRLHLDDSASNNGPLKVLPGTHTQGVFSDDQIHSLSGQIQPVDCIASKGGVVAMRPLLVRASPSQSRTNAALSCISSTPQQNPSTAFGWPAHKVCVARTLLCATFIKLPKAELRSPLPKT